ncbi:MAG: Tol-Pal system beta propeller repeat protein TolB [Acidobacteriota bacterium]|jgi:TolB protein
MRNASRVAPQNGSSSRLLTALLAGAALLMAMTGPAAQTPQVKSRGQQITGTITETGFTQLNIAITPCQSVGSLAAQAEEIHGVVTDDLVFSGYFKPIESSLWAGMNLGSPTIDYAAWRGMNADYLLMTSLHRAGESLILEGRLYDVKQGELVTGKRIKGPAKDVRALAHNLSAVVLDYLFGAGKFPTSQILFASQLGDTQDIFLCDYDGYNLVRLTALGQLNVTPDVNKKGTLIAFTSIMKDRQGLYLLDRKGHRRLLYGRGEGLNASPRFSPDGNTIAFCSSRSGNPDIWTINIDGKNLKRLTTSPEIDTAPTWSPDGKHIAFTSDRGGTPQIYIMDRDGTNAHRISPPDSGRCDQPAWSPKGDKIAYSTMVDGRFNIAVLDLNTNKVTMLTHGQGDNECPSWSPDGNYLAFASNRTGDFQIYIMRWDGTGVKRITHQPDCYSPCWFE